jgi:hypothetical protein
MIDPVQDLCALLENMESTLGCTLRNQDFVIGRQQLFSVFLHEVGHAFITRKAPWIHDLPEKQVDYIDEVLVRIMIHDLVQDLGLAAKLGNHYSPSTAKDLREFPAYGIDISPSEYDSFRNVWKTRYYPTWDLDGMARFLLESVNWTS